MTNSKDIPALIKILSADSVSLFDTMDLYSEKEINIITIPIEAGRITLFNNELKILVLVSVSVNNTKKLLVLRRIVDSVGTKPFDEKKSKTQNIIFWISSRKILLNSSRKFTTVLSI